MRYFMLLLTFMLIGCGGTETARASQSSQQPTKAAALQAVTPTPRWESDPAAVILQVETFGGMLTPTGTDIADWTLYGDGRVVFAVTSENGLSREAMAGDLSADKINTLITNIVTSGFLKLDQLYTAPQTVEMETDDGLVIAAPNPEGALDQPSRTIRLNLKDVSHEVTVYPANWEDAPNAFKEVETLILQPDNVTPLDEQ